MNIRRIKILSIVLILFLVIANRKKMIPVTYEDSYLVNKNLFVYLKDNKFGIMNSDKKVLVQNEYDEISKYIDKIFIGEKNLKYALYNLKNKKVSKDYDYIEQIGENEFRGGTEEIGKYAFLSENISTDEKYLDVINTGKNIYIGLLEDKRVEIINLESKKIKILEFTELQKYLENLN